MLRTIKLRDDKNQRVFFCSDWHGFHNPQWEIPLWKQRNFNSSEEMTEDIIVKTNSSVRVQDILVNLGDGFLNADEHLVNNFLARINCQTIFYLWGNHESVLSKLYASQLPIADAEVYPTRYKNLVFYGYRLNLNVNKQRFVCSHFPFRIWEKSHHGAIHLSGHSHYSDADRRVDGGNCGKSLDISWDGKLAPYSFEEIMEIMSKKEIQKLDHHDHNTT